MQIAQDKIKLYTSKKIMFNAKVHNEKIYWHIHPWNTNAVSIWKLKRLGWRKVERPNQQDQLNIFQSSSCKADRE